MNKSKKITKSGGITIPKIIRHEAGILPGIAVDVTTDDAGIHIKKHVPTCNICGNVERVATYRGFDLCVDCLLELNLEANIDAR